MMKEELISRILAKRIVSRDFSAYLLNQIRVEKLKKGHALLKKGEICHHIWLIEKGLAKSRYFDQTGKQIITRFWKENEIMLAKGSFNDRVPAKEDIILLENAVVVSINFPQAQFIYHTFPESHTIARQIHVTDEHSNRLRFHLLTLPASDAYKAFCQEFKSVPFTRFQQQDIAAYLNLSPHTVSMIRREK